MPTNSPLYNFINDVLNPEELIQYKLEKKETKETDKETGNKRFYYLLHLDQYNPILPSPYDSCRLIDTHFSIDELYYANFRENIQDGKTPIHYTQIYMLAGKEISVRVYLDEDGEYLYYTLPDEIKLTNDLKSALEQKLKENLQDASPALKTLIAKLKAHSAELKNQADSLDIELTRLSCNYKSNRQEYITKAYQFIGLVKQLNRYRLKQDGRGACMASMIANLEAIFNYYSNKLFESKSSDNTNNHADKTTDTSDASQSEPKEAELSPKQKIVELYKAVFHSIKIQFEAFKSATQESEKNIIAKNLQDQLFLIDNFEKELISTKDSKKISNINKALNDYKDTQINKLKDFALKGDLQNFKSQYVYCSDRIQFSFYEALINHLIEKPWNANQEKILKILDYLNDIDPNYKKYIKQASSKNKYKTSPRAISIFLINPTHVKKKNLFESSEISLLFKIYSDNKLPLFIKLINHGANTNVSGIINDDNPYQILSLFYCIIYFCNDNYLEYVKVLIENDTNISIYAPEIIKYVHKMKASNAAITAHKKTSKKYAIENFNHFSIPIRLISEQSGTEGLNIILPKTPLRHQAIYCMQLIHCSLMAVVMLRTTDQYHIAYKNTVNEAFAYADSLPNQCTVNGGFINYISCPNPEFLNESSKKIPVISSKLNLLLGNIYNKLQALSLKEFEKEYDILADEAYSMFNKTNKLEKSKEKDDFLTNSYPMFLACELLLFEYVKTITNPKDQNSLIQRYAPILYKRLIKLMKANTHLFYPEDKVEYYEKLIKPSDQTDSSDSSDTELIFDTPAALIIKTAISPENSAVTVTPTSCEPASNRASTLEHKRSPSI